MVCRTAFAVRMIDCRCYGHVGKHTSSATRFRGRFPVRPRLPAQRSYAELSDPSDFEATRTSAKSDGAYEFSTVSGCRTRLLRSTCGLGCALVCRLGNPTSVTP